ncbi:MAG: sporulation delaying protein family toxin [Bacillota bacterium]
MAKKILSVLISLTVLISVLQVGVFAEGNATKVHQYSGEELLKGIVFGVGDAAKELNTWTEAEYKLNNSRAAVKQVNALVKEIDKIDPTYLERFEKNIHSENFVEVEKNFTELNDLLDTAIKNLMKRKDLNIEKQIAPDDGAGTQSVAAVGVLVYLGAAVTTGAAVTHIVLATAGGAVAAYLYVYGAKYFWGPDSVNPESSQLVKEEFVDSVITNYN